MNTYLVMSRCGLDDVPMLLTTNYDEARTLAMTQTVDSVIEFCNTSPADIPEVSIVHAVDLYAFTAGQLMRVEHLNSFDA